VVQEIANGVFVKLDYEGANVGCVLTKAGAIVIDTPMIPDEAEDWAKIVATLTDKVLYVFNTDHHRAHILGNQFFEAPVLAHEAAWKEMSNYKETFIERPKTSSKSGRIFNSNWMKSASFGQRFASPGAWSCKKEAGKSILCIWAATPRPPAAFICRMKKCSSPRSGGSERHPALGQCDSEVWLRKLRWLRKQKFSVVVPGHGDLCDVEASEPVSEYIRAMRSKVRKQYKAGRSKAEAAVVISQMIDFFPYRQGEKSLIEKRIRAGVSRVYDEMKTLYNDEDE
jgi:cyclase